MNRQIFFKIGRKLQSIIAPKLRYSQYLYEDILNEYSNGDKNWLDLGCGHYLLPPWRLEEEKKLIQKSKSIVGLDYDMHSLKNHKTFKNRVRGDISYLPFKDSCFELITSNMVFEHVETPEIQMREIARILKPGGLLIFHTPNTKSYGTILARLIPEKIKSKLIYILQRREEEDVFPAYYRINSLPDIEKYSRKSGLKIRKIKMICSTPQLVIIPPLAAIELLWIRLLMTKRFRKLRSNFIAIIEKPKYSSE